MRKNRRKIFLGRKLSLKNVKILIFEAVIVFMVVISPKCLIAQQQKVTIDVTKVSLQEVFKRINKQTGLDFVYNVVQMKEMGAVTLHLHDVTVDSVLSKLFTGTPFEYKFEMKSIIVKKRLIQES